MNYSIPEVVNFYASLWCPDFPLAFTSRHLPFSKTILGKKNLKASFC